MIKYYYNQLELEDFGMNFKKLIRNKKLAFTLAEVVVVMAILGIMMAAFAPVVTKRTLTAGGNNKITFDIMKDHTGVYYGTVGDEKTVVIGDTEIDNSIETKPKLFITGKTYSDATSTLFTPQILFGSTDGTTKFYNGYLAVTPDIDLTAPQIWSRKYGNIILGGPYNEAMPYSNTYYNNTIIGLGTAYKTSQQNLTAIGANACFTNLGNNVVCIGAKAGSNPNTMPGVPALNSNDNLIYIGNSEVEYTLDKIYFGKNKLEKLVSDLHNNLGTQSDIRLKNVGKEFKGGIDELNQLTFYNYTYKRDAEKTPRVGVMAQDLQKVFPNAVAENKDGYLYIRKDDMFYAALNAIKDLFQKMTDNSEKIKALEERNAVLEKQVKELQDLYIDLANKVDKKSAKKKLTITPETVDTEEVTTIETETNTVESMPEIDTETK